MRPRTQEDLLRALRGLEPAVRIFGGIAEDALLHGRASRAHEDVDVMVFRDELDLRLRQAHALGFHEFYLRMESAPGVPLVIGSVVGAMNLEFVIFDRHADGRVSFDTPTPAGLTRVWLPRDALDHPASRYEGIEVRTVSPLALYQIRAGVTETFGGMRPKDKVSQVALRRRFFPEAAEAALAPRIDLVAGEALSAPQASPS